MTMLRLSTERLQLLALTDAQLRQYLVDPGPLEEALALRPGLTPAEPPVRQAIGLKLAAMGENEEDLWPWLTYWLVIVTAEAVAAGLAGFKGLPDDDGRVEIGYGIDPTRRRRGYATEAVGALVSWAFTSSTCRSVTARTLTSNEASQAVLRNSDFRLHGVEEDELLWQIDRVRNESQHT